MFSKFNLIFLVFFAILISCEQTIPSTIDAFSLIQAENFNREIGKVDNGNYNGISRFDRVITYSVIRSFDTGDIIVFENVDFKDGAQNVTLNIAQNWGEPDGAAKIEFRLDQPDGELIGTLDVAETEGWEHYMFQNTNITKVTGVHDLYLVADHLRGAGDIDWIVFSKDKALKNSLMPAPFPA
jgi:endo-1,4-beta-xylanase